MHKTDGTGEVEWYILLVQYISLIVKSMDKHAEGYAWDYAFVKANSAEQAIQRFKQCGKCTLSAYEIGSKTQVLVHRVEPLEGAMTRCETQPRRRRKRGK